jgi:hypothetical protein
VFLNFCCHIVFNAKQIRGYFLIWKILLLSHNLQFEKTEFLKFNFKNWKGVWPKLFIIFNKMKASQKFLSNILIAHRLYRWFPDQSIQFKTSILTFYSNCIYSSFDYFLIESKLMNASSPNWILKKKLK